MAEEPFDDTVAEQNRRKLQEHLEKLKQFGGKPPEEEKPGRQPTRGAAADRLQQRMREFEQDFASWQRLYGGPPNPNARSARDRAKDCKLLGVSTKAGPDEIRKAFHALAKKNHPDQGGDEAKFRELMEAYRHLTA